MLQVKAKLKLSGIADIYLSAVSSNFVRELLPHIQPQPQQHAHINSAIDHYTGVLQNGHKVRSVSELQDIDELCVVEVGWLTTATVYVGVSSRVSVGS